MKNRFGVELNPDTEIFSLIGSKEGIANFIRLLINPTNVEEDKDIIFIPDPGYASYGEMIKVSGGKAYPLPLTPQNNFMPNLEEVYAQFIKEGYNPKKVKALLINYPNNPLGATATREYLESVVEFCKKHHILLVSDAAYTDMYFKEYNVTSDLSCKNTTDQFSVSNNKAKLTYKIGLMSSPEMNILNNQKIIRTGQEYWLISPYFIYIGGYNRDVYYYGGLGNSYTLYEYGVRPAVSLKPGIKYVDGGDGSKANPYVVKME
jgi:aspartate/methionine/tyrosine aminotransferase